MIYKDKTLYVYRKRVMPAKPSHDLYSFAIVLLNYGFLPIVSIFEFLIIIFRFSVL